jgi:hypothetical protein
VKEMRRVMAAKMGVQEGTFEMLLEVSLSNGGKDTLGRDQTKINYFFSPSSFLDKSTRKMDEDEYIQQVLDKHRMYSTRLMWLAPKNTPTSTATKQEVKVRKGRAGRCEV